MSDHVPLPPELALPAIYAHVPGYLAQHDPELRLRCSAERPTLYVLERRCRRRSSAHLGMSDLSDMHVQLRDGYIHVATVHPSFLEKPWNIVRALREEGADLFAESASRLADDEAYEQVWQQESRRRRRLGLYRDIAADWYDVLSRHGNRDGTERTRISAPIGPTRLGGQVVTP